MSDLDRGMTAFRDLSNRPHATPVCERVSLPEHLQWAYVHMQCPEGCMHPRTGRSNMAYAIEAYDPFNDRTYWPLRNVIPYLGRMGVHQ